jgi:hypothetical protein
MADPTTYELGETLLNIASLTSLGIPNPQSQHYDYSQSVVIGNGQTKGLGYPRATWYYGYLTQPQFKALSDFVSGLSATAYFSTMTNTTDFKTYRGIMRIPETYKIRKNDYIDVSIEFTLLEIQTV